MGGIFMIKILHFLLGLCLLLFFLFVGVMLAELERNNYDIAYTLGELYEKLISLTDYVKIHMRW